MFVVIKSCVPEFVGCGDTLYLLFTGKLLIMFAVLKELLNRVSLEP